MPSIAAAVATIEANPAPMVYLDTCVLLDIIRAPLRNTAAAVQAASELMTGAAAQAADRIPRHRLPHAHGVERSCRGGHSRLHDGGDQRERGVRSLGLPRLGRDTPLASLGYAPSRPIEEPFRELAQCGNPFGQRWRRAEPCHRAGDNGRAAGEKGRKGRKRRRHPGTRHRSHERAFGPMGFCSDAFLPAQIPTILPSRKRPHFIPFLHRFLLPQPASTTQPVSRRRSRCLKEGAGCPDGGDAGGPASLPIGVPEDKTYSESQCRHPAPSPPR